MDSLPHILLGLIGFAAAVYVFVDWVAGQVDLDVRDHEE
jgi:hypothetical protein